ncbi:Gfo/Idh/MocA family oxidoreductase [Candidatus Poribacteria bacterium]|nr:Gfo/Idh/MocA family oxidoreductase [Candidatus Poribacteria bacterium]
MTKDRRTFNHRTIRIGLIGAGMFGGDVHLQTYANLQRSGIAPWLGRIGMDDFARQFADVRFELVGVATRTVASAKRAQAMYKDLTGAEVVPFHGESPWVDLIDAFPDLDILAVATPDHLHTAPIKHALENGIHVIVEKPMTLDIVEADEVIALAQQKNLIVGLDMHKRYDPDHLKIFHELLAEIGEPIYGRAVLEEPLEVSTKTFKWATQSDPFSYVGCHWTDLFISYLKVKPASLFAVGQKAKLINEYNIDAYDAVQVDVIFDNGMNIHFANHWITPPDFEGPVNQESEILGTRGKIESDAQYRGLRYTIEGKGSRTSNTHFTRDVMRPDGSKAYVGYGKDSLIACVQGVVRMKFADASLADIAGTYPDADEARLSVAILHAARIVRDRNYAYLQRGMGTPTTAKFGADGITILDPYNGNTQIYNQPI